MEESIDMSKKDKERDQMTESNDQTKSGRVKQSKIKVQKLAIIINIWVFIVCRNFLVHADSGLAHRLQAEECKINHYFNSRCIYRKYSCCTF